MFPVFLKSTAQQLQESKENSMFGKSRLGDRIRAESDPLPNGKRSQ